MADNLRRIITYTQRGDDRIWLVYAILRWLLIALTWDTRDNPEDIRYAPRLTRLPELCVEESKRESERLEREQIQIDDISGFA